MHTHNTFVLDRASVSQGFAPPLYLCPEAPYWFVPNESAAGILAKQDGLLEISAPGKEAFIENMRTVCGKETLASAWAAEHFFSALALPSAQPYAGRKTMKLNRLSELWFHLTDACNLRCSHCLFGHNFSRKRQMDTDWIRAIARESLDIGCGLICFTGGEPFLYPGFSNLLTWLHKIDDLKVAVLTNGILLPQHIAALEGLARDRIHFQVSLEGPQPHNDAVRGKGSFEGAVKAIRALRQRDFSVSAAITITGDNMEVLPEFFAILHDLDVGEVHFQYHFKRGFAEKTDVAVTAFRQLLPSILNAAEEYNITIDNVEAVRSQIFTPPGTRFDFGNGGWESLAIAPDGMVYPTPASIDLPYLQAGNSNEGLKNIWQKSPQLKQLRSLSLLDVAEMAVDPYRFLIGGGDLDHCITGSDKDGNFQLCPDPYAPIARDFARYLIGQAASSMPQAKHPGICLRMGDVSTECPSGAEVNFTHCNCLLSLGEGARGLVRNFYGERAEATDESILNPVHYDEAEIAMIPEEARGRMYGCGSPVDDAGVQPGETLVDLGSGTGVECFLASRRVGPEGKVFGIDMTDRMLAIAGRVKTEVEQALGYANVQFKKGFLEDLPLDSESTDVVISNCVVNLSENKRKVFAEILRVLKPGGRLVISDVVTESEPDIAIRADKQLSGECIGGAMVQQYLLALLRDMGFTAIRIIKRFPYRVVQGHQFFSLTFSAWKPQKEELVDHRQFLYAGPFAGLMGSDDETLMAGKTCTATMPLGLHDEDLAGQGVLTLDPLSGAVTNVEAVCACDCGQPPEQAANKHKDAAAGEKATNKKTVPKTGCLLCGAALRYLERDDHMACVKCGNVKAANALCENGHFICDDCHVATPLEIIKETCLESSETDMIRLLQQIREADAFPMHGPEHHILVPAVILATYRNLGGQVTEEMIMQGIARGNMVPGGACGFMGICGAASGVGIAFSLLLEASPLTPNPRQKIQKLVADVLMEISSHKAARCCQRECFIALTRVAELSKDLLPIQLQAQVGPVCSQFHQNRECIRKACPYYKGEKGVFPEGGTIVFPMANRN